jgi:AcrR family transcriptional regulator
MSEPTADRRTRRTQTALRRAFIDLLLEKGYAKLTVDEVAARADVGRSTLYAHFGGLAGLLRVTVENPSRPLAGLVDGQTTPDQLIWQLGHFKEQYRRNRAFFEDPLRGVWVKRLAELIAPSLPAAGSLPPDLAALQIAEAQIALVRHWLAARPMPPATTVAAAMADVTAALRTALTGADQPRGV